MPRTNTRTRTKTYARTELITLQFRKFLRNYGYTSNCIENIAVAVKNRWVSALEVIGIDEQDQIWVSHRIEIEWDLHDQLVEVEQVAVTDHWKDGIAPPLEDMFEIMEAAMERDGLSLIRQVTLTGWLKKDTTLHAEVCEAMDLVPSLVREWAGEAEDYVDSEPELREVRHRMQMVTNPRS